MHVFARGPRVGEEIPAAKEAPSSAKSELLTMLPRTGYPNQVVNRRREGHVTLHYSAVGCIQRSLHGEACPAYHYCRFTIQAQS